MQTLNENKSTIPKYLEELVKPTPLSVTKLLAAWDGLSDETKIMIMYEYVSSYPIDYKVRVCLNAIKSGNIYLRHLAHEIGTNVFDFNLSGETSELLNKIRFISERDESKLVSGRDVVIYGLKCTPEEFFNLSESERLCNISRIKGYGKQVSEFIQYYYQNRIKFPQVSENNIYDILCQYLTGKSFDKYKSNKMYFDGFDEFSKGEDVLALWNLVGIVNEKTAYLLIKYLPSESGFNDFTTDIIQNLPEKYLVSFLGNQNNNVSWFRKSIFDSSSYSQNVKDAAICCHFYLSEQEFLNIVKYDTQKRLSIIEKLVFAYDIDICIFKAISDLLMLEKNVDYMSIKFCKEHVERSLKRLSPEFQVYKVNLLRLYEIAKRILPWNETTPREFNFPNEVKLLKFDTVGLNTWEIFIKIKEIFEFSYKNNDKISIVLDKMVDVEEKSIIPIEDCNSLLLKKVYELQEEIKNQELILSNISESTKNNNLIEIKTLIFSSISEQLKFIINTIEKHGQQQNRLHERLDKLENDSDIIKNRIKKYFYIILFSCLSYTIINYIQKFFN